MKVCRGLSNRDLEQDAEIEGIYTRLEAIAAEQTDLKARLVELQLLKRPLPSLREASSVTPIAQVTNASPAAECQSARKVDPGSASNIDPPRSARQ